MRASSSSAHASARRRVATRTGAGPTRRRAAGALALALLAVAAAACSNGPGPAPVGANGIGAKSVPAIFASSVAALRAEPAVAVTGEITSGASALHAFDVVSVGTGARTAVAGRMAVSGDPSAFSFAGSFSFVRLDGKLYLNGDQDFWTSLAAGKPSTAKGRALLQLLYGEVVGRWVVYTPSAATELASDAVGLMEPFQFASAILSGEPSKYAKVNGPTIDGEPTVALTADKGGQLAIATVGAPLPLQASGELTAAGRPATVLIHFSYPKAPTIVAPGAAPSVATLIKALEKRS